MSARASWDRHLGKAVDAAIRNVQAFGDTDLFPDPLESRWIRQAPRRAREAVLALHRQLDRGRPAAPDTLRALFPAGTAGYRLGSQIDPVWNLYLLALAVLAGPVIEAARQPRARQAVFSFRFIQPDDRGRIFDPECGWRAFTQCALELAGAHAQVVVCDLADFYHRIDSSMAEAALARTGVAPALARRLARVLRALDADRLGLPVGGPASRLVAEAVLCEVDDVLAQAGWTFCRFVDDIRLFAPSREAALHGLALLSRELLLRGLSLQKSKSRIVPGPELVAEIAVGQGLRLEPSKGGGGPPPTDLRRLLLAPAVFDPYSGLRAQRDVRLEQFGQHADALPLLRREFSKARVNPAIARNMLSALAYMPATETEQALLFLLDPRRQAVVLPVIGKLLAVALEQCQRLAAEGQARLRASVLVLLGGEGAPSPLSLLHLPSSQSQALRVLQALPPDHRDATRSQLARLFSATCEPLVRREILWLWGVWGLADEVREAARSAGPLGGWERRALAGACACLGLPAPRPPARAHACDAGWVGWLATLPAKQARDRLTQRADDAV